MKNNNFEIISLTQQESQLQLPSSSGSGYPSVNCMANTYSAVSGRWTNDEHELFLRGLKLYNRQWKHIAEMIQTRTVVQIRTHAQKYFQKLSKNRQLDKRFDQKSVSMLNNNTTPEVPSLTTKSVSSPSKLNNDSISIDFELYWKVTDTVFVPVDVSTLPFEWENLVQQLQSVTTCTSSNKTSMDSYLTDATNFWNKFVPNSLISDTAVSDSSFDWNLGRNNKRDNFPESSIKNSTCKYNCDSKDSPCKISDESSDDEYFLGTNCHVAVTTIKKRTTADMYPPSKRRERPKRSYSFQNEKDCMAPARLGEFNSIDREQHVRNSIAFGNDTNMALDQYIDLAGCNSDDEALGKMIFESFAN